MIAPLFVGLPEMEAIALIGLLAIASVAAWTSAALWQRQRAIERDFSLLYEQFQALQPGDPAAQGWDDERLPNLQALAHGSPPGLWAAGSDSVADLASSGSFTEASAVADQLLQSSPESLRRLLRGSLDLSQPAIFASTDGAGNGGYAGVPWRSGDLER